jgi:hypothetical protein
MLETRTGEKRQRSEGKLPRVFSLTKRKPSLPRKPIAGYEERYFISDCGKVARILRPHSVSDC